ncbi:MAG: hypothetical protein M3Q58_01355 [Bacteroidota bacterium]|nr:hypothetical protein [Bacteroidota bacterium]
MKTVALIINFLLFYSIYVLAQNNLSIVVRKPVSNIVAVELTKMNVVYIGIDNPLRVASARDISKIEISNGSMIKNDANNYIIRVAQGAETIIKIYAYDTSGKVELLEQKKFRVKRVPDPVAKFAGKSGSNIISRSDLTSASGVIADLENFDFDFKFRVLEFDITVVIGGFDLTKTSKSNMISSEQSALLKSVKPGGKVYIENIKVKGDDGIIRTLSPINLKIG